MNIPRDHDANTGTTGRAGRFARLGARILISAVIVAGILAAYWPALRGGLVWDDDGHITSPALRSWSGLWRIWTDLGATQQYYPLLHSAFWLEHRLWGDAVLGYHLVNLAQHILAAFLFALVLKRLAVPGAWLAAAIFALHPVHVESVAWITEQKNTLSLVFYLAAALVYLRFDQGRRGRDYALALTLFILALLTKTVTATLPAALLVIIWWKRGRISWRADVLPLLPWLAVGATAGLFTAWVEGHVIGAHRAGVDLTWLQRVQLSGRAICFYAGKLIWPEQLAFIYPRWTLDPANAAHWLPLSGVALASFCLWTLRARSRAVLAAFLIFIGTLFPVLGFFNIYPFRYSFVADHFQYHASLAMIALFSAVCAVFFQRLPRLVISAVGGILLIGLGVLSSKQAAMYRDGATLYRETLRRNPACWMAHNNLGLILAERGRRDDAMTHFRTALALNPDYPEAHNNVGLFLSQSGHFDQATPYLEKAVQLNPAYHEAYNNLAIALAGTGRADDAVAVFQFAVRLKPDSPRLYSNLAKALLLAGRQEEAAEAAAAAAKIRAASPQDK